MITRDELIAVQVGGDLGLRSVPASRVESLVGQRAALDVAAGSLLTPEAVTAENVPAVGFSLVGVAASPG